MNWLIMYLGIYGTSWASSQTIRTDVPGLYGDLQFEQIGVEEYKCVYARRTDYLNYYRTAEVAFQNVFDNIGSAHLVTVDDRGYANNPFQRHFQYQHDLEISPESLFEIGNIQGGQSGQLLLQVSMVMDLDVLRMVVVRMLLLVNVLLLFVFFLRSIMESMRKVICVEM